MTQEQRPPPSTPEGWVRAFGDVAHAARYGRGWTHWVALVMVGLLVAGVVVGLVS